MDNLSFRDMCAAMAMQGLINQNAPVSRNPVGLAKAAFEKANAMLAERHKQDAVILADKAGKR